MATWAAVSAVQAWFRLVCGSANLLAPDGQSCCRWIDHGRETLKPEGSLFPCEYLHQMPRRTLWACGHTRGRGPTCLLGAPAGTGRGWTNGSGYVSPNARTPLRQLGRSDTEDGEGFPESVRLSFHLFYLISAQALSNGLHFAAVRFP